MQQAPVGITILRGPQYLVEMANDAYLRLVDRREADIVGMPLFDALPEVKETVQGLLKDVISTGIPFHGTEYPVPVKRYGKSEMSYFDFLYHPLREENGDISGIIVTVTDVTGKVEARITAESKEKNSGNWPIVCRNLYGPPIIRETRLSPRSVGKSLQGSIHMIKILLKKCFILTICKISRPIGPPVSQAAIFIKRR